VVDADAVDPEAAEAAAEEKMDVIRLLG